MADNLAEELEEVSESGSDDVSENVSHETDDETKDENESGDDTIDEADERDARRQGWAPKEQWRGPPEKWVDAKTFLQRGREVIPIMRERMGVIEKQNEDLKQSLNEIKQFYKDQADKQAKKHREELEQLRANAVSEGNVEEFQKLDKQLRDVETPKPEEQATADLKEWTKSNDWYTNDFEMYQYANQYGEFISGKYKGKEFLQKVEEAVKQKFPDKFGGEKNTNPRREAPTAVGAPSGQKSTKSKKGYEDLPTEAKRACDKFVSRGDMTREEYLAAYEWE